MTEQRSRREFLGISALGLGLAASIAPARPAEESASGGAAAANGGPAEEREITVRVTAGEKRYAAAPLIRWHSASGTPGGERIALDPGKKFQEILGFGGAFTDAACYLFNRMPAEAREKLFHEMFDPSEMGLSVCRTCIGASDYSVELYSFDDGQADPDLTRFSIAHDRAYILPMLRQARQINPDLFLFSSPWSPPGWMKPNDSMLGGSMRKFYFAVYAQYLLKFLQRYAAEGVPIQAITSQNEVDTDQDGKMPACLWGQEYEIEFVRDHFGPLLEQTSTPTKIWILDHNYNLWGRAICELEDAKLRQYCGGIAWHFYAGTPDMMSRAHEAFPDVEMYMTEGSPDYKDPAYATNWCKWGGDFTDILRNWCRSITTWNLALDENGRPNIGPFTAGGMVTIDSQSGEISRSGLFWATAHYARAIRRGARRFDSQGDAAGLQHVAAENPGGQQALILTNTGPARTIELRMANLAAEIPLEGNSLTSLAWG